VRHTRSSSYSNRLLKTVAIYAAIFLVIAIVGLIIFWNYMAAYEKSQPENALHAYLYNLDAKRILSNSDDLVESVNPDVQREAECRQIISDTIRDGVDYKLLMSESNDSKKVYTLKSGDNAIGKVALTSQGKGSFGLPIWQVTEEAYDFSFLLNEGETVDVPQHYKVYANGKLLSTQSLVQQDTPIEVLKDFYADYDTLPYMVTYKVGPYLGDVEITITDAEDNAVTPEQATDIAFILDNCSNAEKETLDNLAAAYINSYVRFSTNADEALEENYQDILSYIVPECALAERMADALNGLKWVKNQEADILSQTVHYRTRLAGGLYLYDVSYKVTVEHQGNSTTTTENVRLLLSQTPEGLKVERMLNY